MPADEAQPDTDLFRAPEGPVERTAVTDVLRRRPGDPFAHDRFLLRQRHLAWNERYDVRDAEGTPLLQVERPARLMASMLVAVAAGLGFMAVAAAFIVLGLSLGEDYIVPVVLSGVLAAIGVTMVISRLLASRRDVSVRSGDGGQLLVAVRQDRGFQPVVATFTIEDGEGQVLARLRKNYLGNLLRRTWQCRAADNEPICTVLEDHVVLALVRRLVGPLFGLLRRNYVFVGPDGRLLGRFNRRFTLLDRYVLDLTPDLDASIDRRVAVALGIMLDTGERR